MTTRCSIYARVSSDEQRKTGLSIPNQLHECLRYVDQRGYILADVGRYADADTGQAAASGVPCFAEDYSARNVETPALRDALAAARRREFERLIVWRVDRMTRGDPDLFVVWRRQFQDYGVEIEFVQTPPTGHKGTDKLIQYVGASASETENANKAAAVRAGKRLSATSRQRHTGPPPFGYTTNGDKQLAIDSETAPLARSIFESYLKGSSLRQIARDLSAAGVPTARGAGAWASQTVSRVLKNPVYRGTYIFGVHQRVEGKIVRAEKAQQVEIECPAIVTPDEWYAVQDRLERSAREVRNRPTKHTYILKGRIFCADCGRAYVGQWNTRDERIEYRHRVRDKGCRHHAVGGWVEDRVFGAIGDLLSDPKRIKGAYDRAVKEHRSRFGHLEELLAKVKADREKTRRMLDRLTSTYLDPEVRMPKAEYVRRRDELAKKADALDGQIASIERRRSDAPLPPDLKTAAAYGSIVKMMLTDEPLTEEDREGIVAKIGQDLGPYRDRIIEEVRSEGLNREARATMLAILGVRVRVHPKTKKLDVLIMGQSSPSVTRYSRLTASFELPLAA